MHPIERRIRFVPNSDVYEGAREAFPEKADIEIIAELMRLVVIVAVCYNDVVEDGQDSAIVFDRHIFAEFDELASNFPWPSD